MLVLLSAPGGAASHAPPGAPPGAPLGAFSWAEAASVLRRAGHLPIDAAMLEAALAEDGPAAAVAARLASHCDAALVERGSRLDAVFRGLRRPVYASVHQLPGADRAPPRTVSPWPWGLEAALRSLDR